MNVSAWGKGVPVLVILVSKESVMQVIYGASVSHALSQALLLINQIGIPEKSRVGDVLVFPHPVTTVYLNPRNRVLWSGRRDANPFFHLMESLWMLAGRNDLAFPLKFNSRFGSYSDDGKIIWGAYGWRWRRFFGYDQLDTIVKELKKNPNSRRCVLTMWNAADESNLPCNIAMDYSTGTRYWSSSDLVMATQGGKDVPCNTHAYFDCRGGVLNMTVCNRSNDMLWGCYGANAVHFSILQEYMAARIGVPVGVYRQVSNNLHLYTDIVKREDIVLLANDVARTDRYLLSHRGKPVTPLVDCPIDDWHDDLHSFFHHGGLWNEHTCWKSKFIGETVVPMFRAHWHWRNKEYDTAMEEAKIITSWEWRTACVEWLERREAKRAAKEQTND